MEPLRSTRILFLWACPEMFFSSKRYEKNILLRGGVPILKLRINTVKDTAKVPAVVRREPMSFLYGGVPHPGVGSKCHTRLTLGLFASVRQKDDGWGSPYRFTRNIDIISLFSGWYLSVKIVNCKDGTTWKTFWDTKHDKSRWRRVATVDSCFVLVGPDISTVCYVTPAQEATQINYQTTIHYSKPSRCLKHACFVSRLLRVGTNVTAGGLVARHNSGLLRRGKAF